MDAERVTTALAGLASIGHGYDVGGVNIRTGYFPVRSGGQPVAVLALEAGASFGGGSRQLERALLISVLLALLGAAALAVVATRQVRAERARQEALAKVARAELLTQIAASAAHEIRNPLGVIRGTVELMRERPGLDERGRASLSDVLGQVERLKQLTEDLLDLSADRPLALETVPLGELLRETVDAAQAAFPGARFVLSGGALPSIQGDAGRLRQVFLNLFQNAAQASPNGKVTVTAEPEAAGVRVRIADDGPGISAEVAARLFEPFVTAREGGTGLGLAVSRRFVERHGGSLRNLEQRAGALFEVVLPRSQGAP
ncbi:MAG: sensor histidine kinase [Myxococcaceae bacterium]|nr:sensor histidine kinase [Myxococcaceae bacterium]